jgi:hypothetical protein
LVATQEELDGARLAPKCFVEDYFFADVAALVAPGGTGKTTLLLYEAVCIALGRNLHGLRVFNIGWTLIISAEDQRERLLARLREVCFAMNLNDEEMEVVRKSVIVWDVTGSNMKLTFAIDGNLQMTELVDDICTMYEEDRPVVIVFDPLVSFGVSEQQVNDNEQALVTAARRIVKQLGCCVRLVHHTGKANSNHGSLDQYAGRGGSALADGCRMFCVLQRFDAGHDSGLRPPPGCLVEPGSSLSVLARPKISYARPGLPNIWIKRTGFEFESFLDYSVSDDEAMRARCNQVLLFLESQIKERNYYNNRQINACCKKMNLTQGRLRPAVAELEASGRIVTRRLPLDRNPSGRSTFLCPAEMASDYEN